MKRTVSLWLVLALSGAQVLSCSKEETPETPSSDKGSGSNSTEAEKSPAPAAEKEKNSDSDSASDKEQGTDDADAGAEEENDDRIILGDAPEIDEISKLVSLLQRRDKEIDLKEREVLEREQRMSGLETATMRQTDMLFKLKNEVSTLMKNLNSDFKEERKLFEEKKKKEAALRDKKEKEALAAKEAAAEKRRKLAEEMAEKREQRTVHLTATIKGMRPSSGAGMLASMDEADAVAVLRQLGARQAAALLGNMPADKAAALAEAMLGPKPTIKDIEPPKNQGGTPAETGRKNK
jgi:flagellar motility protein MotE (MotC chaperone)